MSARKAWGDLSPGYRHRLEQRGITAATHASANKTEARGHPSPRPAGAVPKDLISRVVHGDATRAELKNLTNEFVWPTWVPHQLHRQGKGNFKVSGDVAAALSQLPDPSKWKSVDFTPRDDGQPWTMTVKMKGNAYDRVIEIPGGGGPGSGAKETLEVVTAIQEQQQQQRKTTRRHYRSEALFYEVLGSDEPAA